MSNGGFPITPAPVPPVSEVVPLVPEKKAEVVTPEHASSEPPPLPPSDKEEPPLT